MRLLNLKLQNICQHESLDWQFENGLVGVCGPNGSGKSNALNVACYAGITNDYSRHILGKPGMIRQQAGEEGKSFIEVTFKHDGHTVKLERGLQKPSRHRMWVDDQDELRKANEIQLKLEGTLGITKQLIDQYMFVGQNDLYAFLSDTPAVRAKAFAHLCNTTHAEHCWDVLGEYIEMDRDLAVKIVDNTDEIRHKIGELNTKLRTAKEELEKAMNLMQVEEEVEAFNQTLRWWQELVDLKESLPEKVKDEADKKKVAVDANKKQKESAKNLEIQEKKVDESAARAQEADKQLATYESAADAWDRKRAAIKRWRDAKTLLAELEDPPIPPTDDEKVVREELSQLEAELGSLNNSLDSLEHGGVTECPTCGTSIEDIHDHIEEWKERVGEITPFIADLRKRCKVFGQYDKAKQEYDQEHDKLQSQAHVTRIALKDFEGVEQPAAINQVGLDKAVQDHAEAKRVLKKAQEQHTANVGEFEREKALHQTAKSTLENAREKIEYLEEQVDEKHAKQANEILIEHEAAAMAASKAENTIENVEEFIQERREELKKVQAQLKRSQRARGWLRDLAEVRNEVMHRDKLPSIVHRNALLNMEDEINGNLEYFNSPYFVTTDEGLDFTAKFANGTVMPANGLSGGQKVMLAMSFRLAVNSMFASQVGMMILDEPTDGLDADNRQLAAEVFRTMGRLARERGHQVIVITHDDALVSVFDQKFVLAV